MLNQWRCGIMDLKKQTSDAWAKKSSAELREFISKGVAEINERKKTVTSSAEKDFIDKISKMQGLTKTGKIKRTANKLTNRELAYRARKINQFLEVDASSKQAFKNLRASTNEARLTFNQRYDTNLTKKQYEDMVELMGAFKDQTQGFSSSQISTYVEYARDSQVDIDELPRIFGEAVQLKGVTEHERNEFIFDRIDELRL